MTQEEINKRLRLQRVWSHVDYAVGDWVETCNMMPGIVQSIEIGYDEEQDCVEDTVVIFYPHYALNSKYHPYKGGSQCSVVHCGVHKITPEYACKLMSIGEEKLKELWKAAAEKGQNVPWSEIVEKYYKETISKL